MLRIVELIYRNKKEFIKNTFPSNSIKAINIDSVEDDPEGNYITHIIFSEFRRIGFYFFDLDTAEQLVKVLWVLKEQHKNNIVLDLDAQGLRLTKYLTLITYLIGES